MEYVIEEDILHIPSAGLRGFRASPDLEALKTLKFYPLEIDDQNERLIFPRSIPLTQSFPNVREIHMSNCHLDVILNRLPESSIAPWGSQIKCLKVAFLTVKTLSMLQARFPSIDEFQFMGSSNDVGEVFPALSLWHNLKSLAVGINYGRNLTSKHLKLDCAFTGLSEEVLDKLLDSSLRGNFTDDEIQGFKDNSPMSKFKELQFLTLAFIRTYLDEGEDFGFSLVANEFGFKLLSRLNVTLGNWQFNRHTGYIKRMLEPLARSDNIVLDDHLDIEW